MCKEQNNEKSCISNRCICFPWKWLLILIVLLWLLAFELHILYVRENLPRPYGTFDPFCCLEHDLLTAAVVTLHHVWASITARCPSSRSRPSGSAAVRIWRLCYAQTHTEPLIAAGDVVHAASVLGRVVAYGCVLVRALRAGQRQTVRPQEVIQVLIAVTRG